jgi:ATP adenylyltransferase
LDQGYFFNFEKMAYVQSQKPKECLLCLIRDRHPDSIDLTVYRDDLFIVTVNLYPYNPGHLMIFPTRHIEDIREYTAEEENRMVTLNRIFLNILDSLYNPSGYNLGYNMGLTSGASIKHLHYHVIPRYPRELGVADLIAGKRVLVEDPRNTRRRIEESLAGDSTVTRLQQKNIKGR